MFFVSTSCSEQHAPDVIQEVIPMKRPNIKKSTPLSPENVILDPKLYVVRKNYKIWKQKDILEVAMSTLPQKALKEVERTLEDLPAQHRATYVAFVARMEPMLVE